MLRIAVGGRELGDGYRGAPRLKTCKIIITRAKTHLGFAACEDPWGGRGELAGNYRVYNQDLEDHEVCRSEEGGLRFYGKEFVEVAKESRLLSVYCKF